MKDKVFVKIKGLQTMNQSDWDGSDEPVEIINVGSYSVVGDTEYIKYDEVVEGEQKKCSNLIKIKGNTVQITKRGQIMAHLYFVLDEKTMTCYNTPYGNVYLGIFTRDVYIVRKEEELKVCIEYAMDLNYEHVSNCRVEIVVTPKGKIEL